MPGTEFPQVCCSTNLLLAEAIFWSYKISGRVWETHWPFPNGCSTKSQETANLVQAPLTANIKLEFMIQCRVWWSWEIRKKWRWNSQLYRLSLPANGYIPVSYCDLKDWLWRSRSFCCRFYLKEAGSKIIKCSVCRTNGVLMACSSTWIFMLIDIFYLGNKYMVTKN